MQLDFDFIKSVFKWLLKGIFFSAGVLLVIFTLYVATSALFVYENYNKCNKNVLNNDQEAIGALKYYLMREKRYDEISIISPPRKVSTGESDAYNLHGWKISVRLTLKGKIIVEDIYVTNCAEIYSY